MREFQRCFTGYSLCRAGILAHAPDIGGAFTATQFYADVEGHPDDAPVARALEELRFFSREVRILGVYEASDFRASQARID